MASVARFDEAVQAIIDGDAGKLRGFLETDPSLIEAQSCSKHRSTLHHYVAANRIEKELQRTPANAPGNREGPAGGGGRRERPG